MGTVTLSMRTIPRRCMTLRVGLVCFAYWLCPERFKDRLLYWSVDFLLKIDPALIVERWPRVEL